MIPLSRTVDTYEFVWVAVAVFGLFYCLLIRSEAEKDLIARHAAGINSGREELAKLLVTTSTLSAIAFIIWLVCGLLLWTEPPVMARTPYGYVVKIGIISSEVAIAAVQFIKQRVRRRVLLRDMKSKATREAAAAALASQDQQEHTEALNRSTVAIDRNSVITEAVTHALTNGPLAAQSAQTEATGQLTEATEANTDVIKISTEIELKKLDGETNG